MTQCYLNRVYQKILKIFFKNKFSVILQLMGEIVTGYDTDDWINSYPIERNRFYNDSIEAHKKGHPVTRAVEIVDVLIINKKGELLIQKRSKKKNHNPGLLDKSMGGHVQHGESVEHTLMVETVQELQVPSLLLNSNEDFEKALNTLHVYLNTIALIKKLGTKTRSFTKIIDNEKVLIGNKKNFFIGIYDGAVKLVDGEASGLFWYELKDLLDDMKKQPHLFTHDLMYMLEKYDKEILDFIEKSKTL